MGPKGNILGQGAWLEENVPGIEFFHEAEYSEVDGGYLRSSTFALVPVFVQLSILQSLIPAAGAATPVAISALHLCYSHVTPGDPGAGAGQDPAPS